MTDEQTSLHQTPPPLAYAPATDASECLWAYRLVGWYFVLTAIVAAISMVTYTLAVSRAMGVGWLQALLASLTSSGPSMLFAIGGAAMVRGRSWGAWLVVAVCGLQMLLGSGAMAYQLLLTRGATPQAAAFMMHSGTSMILSASLHALLPIATWYRCRSRGVWA